MKRGRFQIHLSTAIVMMFVAGAFAHVNLRYHFSRGIAADSNMITLSRGWPLPAVSYMDMHDEIAASGSFEWAGPDEPVIRPKFSGFKMSDTDPNEMQFTFHEPEKWYPRALIADIAFGLIALGVVALGFEHLIRRRKEAVHER